MIESQLYRLFQGLITQALNEVINRELTPLLSKINSDKRKLLTYTEAMTQLHVSKPIFYRLLREQKLRRVIINTRTFRIDFDDLIKFIEDRKR